MLKSLSIKSILAGVAISYCATEAGMWVLHRYVDMIIVRGSERSPFDRWVLRTFATDDQKEAVDHAGTTKEGAEAIQEGGNVQEVTNVYNSIPVRTAANKLSPVNVWKVCSKESYGVCLLMPPSGGIIFLTSVNENDQKCRTTFSHNGKTASLSSTYISGKTLSVYTLRTKAGRDMTDIVKNSTNFSISYTCEFGPSASFNFDLEEPLSSGAR